MQHALRIKHFYLHQITAKSFKNLVPRSQVETGNAIGRLPPLVQAAEPQLKSIAS